MTTARARRTDPETSHQAAANVAPLPSERAVLDALSTGEATDEEILQRIRRIALIESYPNWAPQRIRDARKVMQRRGLVRHATDMAGREKYGTTKRGGKCRIWVLDGEMNRRSGEDNSR